MITAEEFLKQELGDYINPLDQEDIPELLIKFAKLHAEEALQQATYKLTLSNPYDSILNAYPLENIK